MPRKARAGRRLAREGKPEGAAFALPLTVSRQELIDNGGDGRFRQLIYDLSILASHLDTARKVLASRIGLTPPQYNVVMVVAQYQGNVGVSVGTVADHLHVSPAFVAGESTRLVQKQLLIKAPNPEDGRGVLLRLSQTAEKKVAGLGACLVQLNDEFFASLTRRDFADLSRIVGQMVLDSAHALSVLHLEEQAGGKRVIDMAFARRLQQLRNL